tara:strand:- start:1 stop:267 length:267 start_codon:yes stop_codon:yes gene_type:complete
MTTSNLEAFGDVNFPEHLTPKIVHSALFIHNAKDKAETVTRVKFLTKEHGEKMMTYVMALLILPVLMDNMKQSTEYTTFLASRKKTIN